MSDVSGQDGVQGTADKRTGLRFSHRSEQIAYWAAAGTVFVVICAVLILEPILPFATTQSEEPAPAVLEAEKLTQNRQLREARIKLDEHIAENPGDARAHAARGMLRSATGLFAAALDDYDRAVRLHPGNVDYRQSRADINASIGWHAKAERDYNEILIRDPSNLRALLSRAQLSIQRGDAQRAMADIDIAIEVAPENDDAHLLRAQLMQNTGNAAEALASYRRIRNASGEIAAMVKHNIEILEQHLQQQQ